MGGTSFLLATLSKFPGPVLGNAELSGTRKGQIGELEENGSCFQKALRGFSAKKKDTIDTCKYQEITVYFLF